MKCTKSQLIVAILSIAVLVVSLVVTLCDAIIPLKFWLHPALTFGFCIFIGFGLILTVLGLGKKSVWYLFLGSVLLGLALIYAISQIVPDVWWVGIIVAVVVWAIFGVMSFVSNGNKTEEIALNKSPEYKNYEQRKAEKDELEKNKEKEELPKIKSFKD